VAFLLAKEKKYGVLFSVHLHAKIFAEGIKKM
jgi:hypothetical protein